MSDTSSSGSPNGGGNGRGRARGRALASAHLATLGSGGIEEESSSNGSNGNRRGSGSSPTTSESANGAAIRGRGGMRFTSGDQLRTKPEGIVITTGDQGDPIQLLCNFFELICPTDKIVNDYHVQFEPNVEAIQLRRILFNKIADLFNHSVLYDGWQNCKSLVRVTDSDVTKEVEHNDVKYEIKIKYVNEVSWGSPEMVRLYNTQMRRNLQYIGMTLMGRNYFDHNAKEKLRDSKYNVELWPGYVTRISYFEEKVLMCCEFATKFVRGDDVLKNLQEFRSQGGDWQNEAKRQLVGQIVMTKYNNKTYRIDDFNFEKTPETYTFLNKGAEMNLIKYYKERWAYDIRQPRQPLVVVMPNAAQRRAGNDQPIILIPELCLMTGLTDQMRNDFGFMRNVQERARLIPNERRDKLLQLIKRVKENEQVRKDMDMWGIRFTDNLLRFEGRVLPQEKIFMQGDQGTLYAQRSGDFSKEVRSKRMPQGVIFERWAVVCPPSLKSSCDEFLQTLQRIAQPMGLQLNQPMVKFLDSDRTSAYVDMCSKAPGNIQFIVCIVPNNNKERYDSIKKALCIDKGIPSQVIVQKSISKRQTLMSITTKIGIQMAVKLGAQAWHLSIPPKDIMVVGYDTYHDSLQKGQSVGAFLCSINQSLTAWFSRVSYHRDRDEMSSNFALNLTEGIKKYYEKNKQFPGRVLLYRDGVSEGMIPHVFDFELKQIKEAIEKVEAPAGVQIGLTFTIVTKRLNQRFFEIPNGNLNNPPPGTVIDHTVTRAHRYDFFLISQSVKQGTVSPTMYNIIFDESNWRANHHQQLAYKLTHLYFNWQGTIRVPAPCQYAHKLAYLTGTSLHRVPNVDLSDLLWFL